VMFHISPFVQFGRGIVNAVLKLVTSDAIYNDTGTVSKEVWAMN
jgi:hypothetical protein